MADRQVMPPRAQGICHDEDHERSHSRSGGIEIGKPTTRWTCSSSRAPNALKPT